MLKEKRLSIGNSATKLRNGLSKLDDTKQSVEKISIELEASKKQVVQYQKQCEDMTPLNVVLLQEIGRYNTLLQSIRKSLENLQNGVKGIVVMSPELEETFSYMEQVKCPPS